jgi:hypothetical protein
LFIEQVKERGEYDKYKGRLEEMLKAEEDDAGLVIGLQDTLAQIRATQQPPAPKA